MLQSEEEGGGDESHVGMKQKVVGQKCERTWIKFVLSLSSAGLHRGRKPGVNSKNPVFRI